MPTLCWLPTESLCIFTSRPRFCEFSEKGEPSAIEGALNFDKMENCVVCKESFVASIAGDLILMVAYRGGGKGLRFQFGT